MKSGRAAVWKGRYDIEIRNLPIVEVKKDGALIKVHAASICGSDAHLMQMDPPYECSIGHEFAGEIVAMGNDANDSLNIYGGPLREGDRIAVYPWITCGKCEGCLKHRPGTCTTCCNSFVYGTPYPILGLQGKEIISSRIEVPPHFKGGFGEYVYIFPGTYVWKIPDDMPSLIATLLDPTAVAVRALELSQREPGTIEEALDTNSKVVILGAGPIGLLTALVLRIMGVEKIIMIDGYVSKLNMAKEVANVDETINFNEVGYESRISMVKEMTNGGADLVVQCANTTVAFVEGLEMIRRLGTLVEVGNVVPGGQEVGIDPARLVCNKHARIIGMSANHPGAFNKAFHILMRHEKHAFDKLFTHICKLEELLGTLTKMRDQDYVKGVVVFDN